MVMKDNLLPALGDVRGVRACTLEIVYRYMPTLVIQALA